MAGMMRVVAGFMVSLSAPRGRINRKYTFLRRILLVHDVPEGASRASNVAENGLRFGRSGGFDGGSKPLHAQRHKALADFTQLDAD